MCTDKFYCLKTYLEKLLQITKHILICWKWYDNNKRSLLTALNYGNPSWFGSPWFFYEINHQSELKPPYAIFSDYSIISSSHLYLSIYMCVCVHLYTYTCICMHVFHLFQNLQSLRTTINMMKMKRTNAFLQYKYFFNLKHIIWYRSLIMTFFRCVYYLTIFNHSTPNLPSY